MNLSTRWLPKIPTGWQIANPKSLFSERTQKSTQSDVHLTPSQKLGVLPQSEYMELTGGSVVLNLTGSDNMKHVEKNDFIIHLRSFQGGIEHSNYSGKVSNAYCVLKPTKQIEPRYFRWVLKSQGYIQELNATTDQLRDGQSIKFEQFASIGLPLPPIEEQRRIADYLDRRSSQIDKILATKEQQIDLLKQEVQTSFTGFFGHPIFSGAEAKESRRLGPCLWVNEGGYWGDDPTGENDTLVLRSTEITSRGKWRELNNGAYRSLNFEFGTKHLLQRDDIVVTKASGSLDHIGKAALVTPEIVSLGASFGNFMQRLRVNREIFLPEYICHFLRSTNARTQLQYMGTTSTGLFNISAELLNDLQVPVVSLSEQHHIVKLLEELESRFEARVSLIEESIKLFEDLKLATISEAVTGKLMFESLKGLVNV